MSINPEYGNNYNAVTLHNAADLMQEAADMIEELTGGHHMTHRLRDKQKYVKASGRLLRKVMKERTGETE